MHCTSSRTSSEQGMSSDQSDNECPPTPDWINVTDHDDIPFQLRYRGVQFEAPNRYDFDTNHGACHDDEIVDTRKEDTEHDIVQDAFQHLCHRDSRQAQQSVRKEKSKRKVTFAPELYSIHSSPLHHTEAFGTMHSKNLDLSGFAAGSSESGFDLESTTSDTQNTDSEEDMYDEDCQSFESFEEKNREERASSSTEKIDEKKRRRYGKSRSSVAPEEMEEIRQRLGKIRHKNKFNCAMKPQDLAARMAKVRVAWHNGSDRVIGNLASELVKNSADESYHERYLLHSRRYCQKLYKLKRRIPIDYPDLSPNDRTRFLLKKIDDYRAHSFDKWLRQRPTPKTEEVKAMKKAEEIGEKLVEIASKALHDPHLCGTDLSIAQIELYSRHMSIDGLNFGTTTNYIRRYLKKCLRKSNEDLERFSILRNGYHIKTRKERRQRRKNEFIDYKENDRSKAEDSL